MSGATIDKDDNSNDTIQQEAVIQSLQDLGQEYKALCGQETELTNLLERLQREEATLVEALASQPASTDKKAAAPANNNRKQPSMMKRLEEALMNDDSSSSEEDDD